MGSAHTNSTALVHNLGQKSFTGVSISISFEIELTEMHMRHYQNRYIIKLVLGGFIHCVHRSSALSQGVRCLYIWYMKLIMDNLPVLIWIFTVKEPIIILKDIQTPTYHTCENADDHSFPKMYHTVVYTLYSAHDSQFNIKPNLATMVIYSF